MKFQVVANGSVPLGVGVGEGVGEGDALDEEVGEGLGVGVAVPVAVGDGEGDGDDVDVVGLYPAMDRRLKMTVHSLPWPFELFVKRKSCGT